MAWTRAELDNNPHVRDDKPQRVRRMFSAIAGAYDLNNRLHALWLDQSWRRRLVELLAVDHDDDVLDVACGTGDLTTIAACRRPASVVGLDFTEAMLEIARTKADRTAFPGVEPTYRWGDAMALDLPDACMSVAMIAFGIRNVQDPATAIAEFHRVLRPGGRLGILEFSEPANGLLRQLNALYTKRIMPWTASLIARDTSGAYHYLPKSVETFSTPADLAAMLQAQGFTVQRQVPLTCGICTATIATA